MRSVIITGAASGVGLATARRLGSQGWLPVLVDLNADGLERAAERLRGEGVDVAGIVSGDVSQEATAERAADQAEQSGYQLGGLVNSAGVAIHGRIPDIDIEKWDRTYAINVRGTFLMMRAAIQRMLPRGEGVIVNIGSTDGLLAEPNLPAYCSTKSAVISLTRAAATDHAREGIRINCVCPGAIDTPFLRSGIGGLPNEAEILQQVAARHPFGRLIKPEDVAGAIAYLFGPDAAAIHGAAMVVDGGLTATWGSVG